ncbi:MAG: hypothetical protein AB7O24_13225 [Kofleriaceae bacterium]
MTITLRRLLTKLTALALTAAPTSAAVASPRSESVDLDVELDGDAPIDREHLDHADAAAALGRSLALALTHARPLTSTRLATTWALSEDPMRRLAVARSLEWTFPLVGDAVVIDHLATDPDPEIRIAAARAAWARRGTGGDPGVLDRLRDDPDPGVRDVALRAFRNS